MAGRGTAIALLEQQALPRDSNDLSGGGVSGPADGMNDMDRVQETLRAIAETQRALVTGCEGSGRRTFARIRQEEHDGVGTAKQ